MMTSLFRFEWMGSKRWSSCRLRWRSREQESEKMEIALQHYR